MANESLIKSIKPQVQTYLAYLSARPNGEEIEYRTPFEMLFRTLQIPFMSKTSIVQEDCRSGIEVDGIPDFFVWDDTNPYLKSLVGFIECKKPACDIEKLIDSEQIKKYSKTCENIIITNYKRFILLQEGKKQHDITLATDTKTLQDFINLLQDFYGYKYPYINTKKTLVSSLAAQSFYYSVALREYIDDKTNEEDDFHYSLKKLYSEYEKSINYHYELADFCDIYSQSLVYGLLLARLDNGEQLREQALDYIEYIPREYRLLIEFLNSVWKRYYLPTELYMALINIGKNINRIDTDAITKEFQKTNNGKQNIAVYLYEDFLAQYDKFRGTENRKEGGVYYTPSEATDFITRGVNYLLKTNLDLPQGYNSENVKILDFACGTGTFLHSVLEQMIPKKPDKLTIQTLKNKITKDIYGFELLFTPYIISHTILTRFLKEKGIDFVGKDDRLGIYLTNTLDISSHSISEFLPRMKKEYEKARDVKDKENILAIIGNPPYFNGKSQAKSDVIDAELKKYKQGLNEQKINLDDLYIKFIRFAEWKIQKCGHGVVGIITNNSFLDGVTHRQMRKHLYNTFDEIYIVNLHGNSRKGESDKNIFDIMVGVSITFFVKHKTPQPKTVKYFSTLDNHLISRAEKLSFLEDTNFSKIRWKKLKPEKTEYYWFVDKDLSLEKEYNKFWKVTDIFHHYNSGIQTKKDEFVLQYEKNNIKQIISDFQKISIDKIKEKYYIEDGVWTAKSAYNSLKTVSFDTKFIKQVQYRPFDNRYTFLHEKAGFLARPRYETNKHFENENIGLIFTRNIDKNYSDVFISDKPIDIHIVSGQNYLAPLYCYNGGNGYAEIDFDGHKRYANFSQNFIKKYIEKFDFQPTSENFLAYIYAVLHSKIYRKKYIEFLKTDFPAVPFTSHKATFDKYAKLGQKLIDLHLFKNLPTDNDIRFNGEISDSFTVEKITQDNNKLLLQTDYNKIITIDGVTTAIYNFEIGSYKPIDKWLKYRIKDKVTLTYTDLEHLRKMIIAIKNTITIMQEIEKLGEEYLKSVPDLD